MILGIVPFIGAGGDEKLWHFVIVQVTLDRGVRRCAQRVKRRTVFADISMSESTSTRI
jgi:hypothetical protein